jgi:hypothetical protein
LAADNTLPDLVHYLSGVMVILLAGLRACALEGVGESGASSGPTKMPSDYVRCLDGTILRTPNGITVDLEKNIFTSYSFSFELSPLDCNCTWKFDIFGHSQCYSTPVS